MSSKTKAADFLLLYFAFTVYSFVSVFAKYAAAQKTMFMTLVFMAGEFLLLGIYAILWQQVLKRFELVVAMSNKGITVILGLIWSALLFSEAININNIIGAVIIMTGIWMVSTDG